MVIDENKKNLLIFFTLSPESVRMLSCQSIVFHNYLKSYNLMYITTGKTPKTLKYFLEDAKIPYIKTNTIFLGKEMEEIYKNANTRTYEDWANESIIHEVLSENNIIPDVILNWGTAPIKDMDTEKLLKVYKESKLQTFSSLIGKIYPIFIIYSLLLKNKDIHYIEHTIDPIYKIFNPDISNKMSYFHEHSIDIHFRHDAYQKYLLTEKTRNTDNKDINLVFGLTAINDDSRINLVKKLKMILKDEPHFYVHVLDGKNPENNEKTLLPRPEYNLLIERAKFTFVAPAYVKGAFSITRLCDTIYHGCCPIFDSRCAFDVLEKDFGIDLEIIKPLIFDITSDSIVYPDDKTRLFLIDYLYDKLFNNLKLDIFSERYIK